MCTATHPRPCTAADSSGEFRVHVAAQQPVVAIRTRIEKRRDETAVATNAIQSPQAGPKAIRSPGCASRSSSHGVDLRVPSTEPVLVQPPRRHVRSQPPRVEESHGRRVFSGGAFNGHGLNGSHVCRVLTQDIRRRALRHQPAAAQPQRVVARVLNHRSFMGHEEDRAPRALNSAMRSRPSR